MIEDVKKYIDNMDAEDIDSVRESMLAQFGPDYCIISTHAIFRLVATAFYLSQRKNPLSAEMCQELGEILGCETKPAVVGAGFNTDDVVVMVNALRDDAKEHHD